MPDKTTAREKIDYIRIAYPRGDLIADIAAALKCDERTVNFIRRQYDIPIRDTHNVERAKELDYVHTAWPRGDSLKDIATALDCSYAKVQSMRRELGFSTRCVLPGTARHKEHVRYVEAAWLRGDSLKDIAAVLECTRDHVQTIRKGLGLPVRRVKDIPLEYLAKIRKMRESGMAIDEIAAKEGKAHGTIHEQLIRAGCGYVNSGYTKDSAHRQKIESRPILSNSKYRELARSISV